jgi:hypothetical protein
MPEAIARAMAQLDTLCASRADSVNVPLRDEDGAKAVARRVVALSAMPPYLRDRGDALTLFWSSRREVVNRIYKRNPGSAAAWRDLVDEFELWLLSDMRAGDELLSYVKAWTMSFDSMRVGCSFVDALDQKQFGYDSVPCAMVHGARWRQVAATIYAARPADWETPPPPDPHDGALRDLLADALDPRWTMKYEPPPVREIVALIADMARMAPQLRKAPRQGAHDATRFVEFLSTLTPPRNRQRKQ